MNTTCLVALLAATAAAAGMTESSAIAGPQASSRATAKATIS